VVKALAGALDSKSAAKLADVLGIRLPALVDVYSKYCAGVPAAQALYEKKMEEPEFAEFENSFTTLNKPTLSHIMRPVQVSCVFVFCNLTFLLTFCSAHHEVPAAHQRADERPQTVKRRQRQT
jgi:hypothetical protein